ncbi:MAG TPA: DNA polymerase III subunit delta [Caulobacteraceae bacterium]|nr:DNA polymerase III subunit delta [Caulobacteraceae bacterium]
MRLRRAEEIEAAIAHPPTGLSAALICGPDSGLVSERADALAAAIARDPNNPFDVARVGDGLSGVDSDLLEHELTSLSLMGGRRLVRLRFRPDAPAATDRAAAALERHLGEAFNPDAFLLIETGHLRSGSGLLRLAEASKQCLAIVCWEQDAGEIVRLIRQRLAEDGLRISPEALDALAVRLPQDRALAQRELERLILFFGPGLPRPISEPELDSFWGAESDVSLSQAALAAFGGRLEAALAALRKAERAGEGGVAALRALGMHLLRLRRVGALSRAGADAKAALRSGGVFWKDEADFRRQLRAWTGPGLDRAQAELLTADRQCKRPGAVDHLIAQRVTLAIAARARRLGL